MIDRYSAVALIPIFLIPLALTCFVAAFATASWTIFVFMALLGICYGFSSTLEAALWPEIYGTEHLGSIRSVVLAAVVFGSAIGPGLTGFLIDAGVAYSTQLAGMGIYCLVAAALMFVTSRRLIRRAKMHSAELAC